MPISTPTQLVKRYRGDAEHFEHVLDELLIPAVRQAGYRAVAPSAVSDDVIQARVIEQLQSADLVLCDLSTLNPNVMFELGIRTALNRPVRLICDDLTVALPFDTGIINTLRYRSAINAWELSADVDAIARHVGSPDELNDVNSLWRHFGLMQRGQDARAGITDDPDSAMLRLILEQVTKLGAATVEPGATGIANRHVQIEDALLNAAKRRGFGDAKVHRRPDKYTLVVPDGIYYDDHYLVAECVDEVHRAYPDAEIDSDYEILE
jgi:hypothetical protein